MKLILGKERQPAHSVALILPQIRLDIDRNFILLRLATIKQLHEELSLVVSLRQQFRRESGWIRDTGLTFSSGSFPDRKAHL
jgi:hypothetical protein